VRMPGPEQEQGFEGALSMSTSHSTRAVAYYRMSTEKQGDSIERQRSQVEPYAKRQGYALLPDAYVDEGIAGDEVERRPAFQRLLRDAHKGKFDVILCDDADRFSRLDSIRYGQIVAPLRDAGIRLETVAQGPVNWFDTLPLLNTAMVAAFKREESKATSRRVLTRQMVMAREGKWAAGNVAYGYAKDADTGKLKLGDRLEVRDVRWLFETYASRDVSLAWLAEELGKRARPTPRGLPPVNAQGCSNWHAISVRMILTNPVYVGEYRWGQTSK